MPHQRHVWDVALEHDGDGELIYGEIDLSTMRQTSKTTIMFVLAVWRLTYGFRRWGPQRSTFVAQKRQVSRKKLDQDVAEKLLRSSAGRQSFVEVRNPKARPVKPTEWKLSLNNGSEHILFGRGNYFQIDAVRRDSGHGDTLDLGMIDEAFAHQTDDAEQAMEPTMATRQSAQLWVASTAGDEKSPYWYRKVLAGRQQVEAGVESRVAYFEWSIPDDSDIDDEDVWWEFMPALGHTISPDFIRMRLDKARRGEVFDDEDAEGGEGLWRRAYGNQWVRTPVLGGASGVFPVGTWQTCNQTGATVGRLAFAFDVAPNGGEASIAFAGIRADGTWHGEVVDCDKGTGWVVPRLVLAVQRAGDRAAVVGTNSSGGLVPELKAQLAAVGSTVEVVEVSQQAYTQACSALYGYVSEGTFRHIGQPWLDRAVAGARARDVGDTGKMWARRSSAVDITPLCAVTVALRAFQQTPEPPKRGFYFAVT